MEDAYEVKLGLDNIGQVGVAPTKEESASDAESEDVVQIHH
jgi:hypothetical protein